MFRACPSFRVVMIGRPSKQPGRTVTYGGLEGALGKANAGLANHFLLWFCMPKAKEAGRGDVSQVENAKAN